MSVVASLTRYATRALRAGDHSAARRVALTALVMLDDVGYSMDPDARADVLHRLAATFRAVGDMSKSEACARASVDASRGSSKIACRATYTMFLAAVLQERGAVDDAAEIAQEAAALYVVGFGAVHPETRRAAAVAEGLAVVRDGRR